MNFETINQPTLFIAGPTISTSHDKAAQDVGAFWGSADIPSLFAKATSEELFAAYYDLDQISGEYEMMIGVAVTAETELPDGWKRVEVKHTNYKAVQLPDAEPASVINTWQYIWSDWADKPNRAFGVDFERYVETENGREAQIRISMQ